MRFSGSCWTCMLLLAEYSGGVWATISDNKHKPERAGSLDYKRLSPLQWLFSQKELGTGCPVDHYLCPDSVGGGCCPNTRVCGTNACLATVEAVVTVSHPKITEAPLFKRKLGSNKWDMIHEGIQGQKRDVAQCGAGLQSCAASLSGGCCPTDRICGTDSCYAASTLPATVCGEVGYVACGIAAGGGCCPQSYACEVGGCSPSPGVSYTQTCGVSSYLCPASVNFGCCPNDHACGVSACYVTSATTFVVTETLTTTDAEDLPHTITTTFTTESTPTLPTDVASNTAPNGVIAKVTPTATSVPKTSPTSTPSSGGLTKGQLGGIIGGAVILLAVLIIATYFIIRRLNKVVKATTIANSRTRSSSSAQPSRPSHQQKPTPSVDALSVDPLIMSPMDSSQGTPYLSHPSPAHGFAYEVDGSSSSPPGVGSPFHPNSPPFNHYPRGYGPVPTSDSNSSSGYGRHPPLSSSPPVGQNSTGYFDIQPQADLRDQNLRFGHSSPPRRPSHQRNMSDVSNLSEFSADSGNVAELAAEPDQRSSLKRTLQGLGIGRLSMRRKSSQTNLSPTTLPGGPTSRHPEWGPGPNPGALGLGHIPEAGESRLAVGDPEMREISLAEPLKSRSIAHQAEQKTIGPGANVLRDNRWSP